MKRAGHIDQSIKNYSEYLDSLNSKAYSDIYLLSNPVLNKNPYTSDLLENYINGKQVRWPNFLFIFYQLLRYFLRNFCFLITWILNKFAFRLGGYSYRFKGNKKRSITLVDDPTPEK